MKKTNEKCRSHYECFVTCTRRLVCANEKFSFISFLRLFRHLVSREIKCNWLRRLFISVIAEIYSVFIWIMCAMRWHQVFSLCIQFKNDFNWFRIQFFLCCLFVLFLLLFRERHLKCDDYNRGKRQKKKQNCVRNWRQLFAEQFSFFFFSRSSHFSAVRALTIFFDVFLIDIDDN